MLFLELLRSGKMKSLNFESDDFDFDFFDDLAAFSVISFAPSRHQDIKLCCLKTFTVYPTYSFLRTSTVDGPVQ